MEGSLHRYGGSLAVFLSPSHAGKRASHFLVLLGGLGDGLLPTPYTEALAAALDSLATVALAQPILSSSYAGYGVVTLDQDVREIDSLVEFLIRDQGATHVTLMGHSTGCQRSVAFYRSGLRRHAVSSIILQAPVSDREFFSGLPGYSDRLSQAKEWIDSGCGHDILPWWEAGGPGRVATTASRFYSLGGRFPHAADDMFSSDLTDGELEAALSHLRNIPSLVIFSGRDEYVPSGVDIPTLVDRLRQATDSETLILPDASHSAKDDTSSTELVREVVSFLERRVLA